MVRNIVSSGKFLLSIFDCIAVRGYSRKDVNYYMYFTGPTLAKIKSRPEVYVVSKMVCVTFIFNFFVDSLKVTR